MIRKFKFGQNSYYHIFNRSNDETTIFFEDRDYVRFLFFALVYQAPLPFFNIGRQVSCFVKRGAFNITEATKLKIIANRSVELNTFVIMPNHFHLLVQEKTATGEGVPNYLKRVQTGYAKYFNIKYGKRGHLFQGPFRAVPVKTNEQLLYLSAYIHRNPRDLKEWRKRELAYQWSSYQDLAKENRWSKLLNPKIILDQFSSRDKYLNFVETSSAKLKPVDSPIKNLLLE